MQDEHEEMGSLYQFLSDTHSSKDSLDEKIRTIIDDPDDVRGTARVLSELIDL